MTPFFALISAVPNVIWSGLLASAVTLAGVLIADWRNTIRQRRQHNFDAEQARIDRTMDIRREVYLPMAAALTKLQNHMFSMAITKPSDSGSSPMAELGEACAKLAMVSTTTTAILAQQLVSNYSSAYMKLAPLSMKISDARTDAEVHKALREKAQQEFDRVTLEINKFLESANRDEAVFNAMRRNQQISLDQLRHHQELESNALQRVSVEFGMYARQAMELLPALSEVSIPVLVQIRAELGQDTDVDELSRAMRQNREVAIAGLRGFLDKMDTLVGSQS